MKGKGGLGCAWAANDEEGLGKARGEVGKGFHRLEFLSGDEVCKVVDGFEFSGFGVWNVNVEFFFASHGDFNHVEGVCAKVVKGGVGCEGFEIEAELLLKNVLDFKMDVHLISDSSWVLSWLRRVSPRVGSWENV